ncbi:lipoprotein signal peptidase [Phyllobacterium ifriqiyense]|uniref:Lipoprotein signal peptidase n=1 Tax=Phyllobacterium ifriqiyense TaxID=314238 RepID=A0ABU0S2R1_9HYPH|nr:VanZ family protein [Phyllobacterium ifriqiyense]MDQ0995004.1 lipoprotein signal peptidase [Phyllobacterium ifriqiyense]
MLKRLIDYPASHHALAWVLLLLIMVMTVGPITLRPATWIGPNVERFSAFLLLGITFSLTYPKRLIFVAIIIIVSCGLFEYAQHFMQNRHADFANFLVKIAGAAMGMAGVKLLR